MASRSNQLKSHQIFQWVAASGGSVPSGKAVAGGYDINGEKIYVGRAHHAGDVIPGKIVPSHRTCYVSYDGREFNITAYEVLCTTQPASLQWLPAKSGQVPTGAIEGGHASNGDKLYISRALHQGSQVIGKVHPRYQLAYIPFDGKEVSKGSYEVLCMKTVAF